MIKNLAVLYWNKNKDPYFGPAAKCSNVQEVEGPSFAETTEMLGDLRLKNQEPHRVMNRMCRTQEPLKSQGCPNDCPRRVSKHALKEAKL